jgi:hypothetical protein
MPPIEQRYLLKSQMIKKLEIKFFDFWSANFILTLFEGLIETQSIGFKS